MADLSLGYCGFSGFNVEVVTNGFIISTNDGKAVAKTEKELFNMISKMLKEKD